MNPSPTKEVLKCKTSPHCSHNTNGRDMNKPCSIQVPNMTREQLINDIRAACIKTNPDIMNLEFGCGVIRYADQTVDTLIECSSKGDGWHYVHLYRPSTDQLFEFDCETKEIEGWVIRGRPIRWDDIILALPHEITQQVIANSWFLNKPLNGYVSIRQELADLLRMWKPGDLTLQDLPTLQFIHSLICKV